MPNFLNAVIAAGQTSAQLWARIEGLFNPEQFYQKRDIIIIQAVRSAYCMAFKDRMVPSELLFLNEKEKKDRDPNLIVTSATPEEPVDKVYRPPYVLPEEYSILQIESQFNRNNAWLHCRNTVLLIHKYLNILNKKANGMHPFSTYGHKNDSIRFVFYMLMNAFVELSNLSFNDRDELTEAEQYITFIQNIVHNTKACEALNSMTGIDMSLHDGVIQNVTPLAVLGMAHHSLNNIRDCIAHHLSKHSILDNVRSIIVEMRAAVNIGFSFCVYFLTDAEIGEDALLMINTDISSKENPLDRLRSLLISASNVECAGTGYVNLNEDRFVRTNSQAISLFNTSEKVPNAQALLLDRNLYKAFKQEELKSFSEFSNFFHRFEQLMGGIGKLESLLQAGADVFAVGALEKFIILQFSILKSVINSMADRHEKLMKTGESIYLGLLGKGHNIKASDKRWMTNYNMLVNMQITRTMNAPRSFNKILQKIREDINCVELIMKEWKENPLEKQNEIKTTLIQMISNLLYVGDNLAPYLPRYGEMLESSSLLPSRLPHSQVGLRVVASSLVGRSASSQNIQLLQNENVGLNSDARHSSATASSTSISSKDTSIFLAAESATIRDFRIRLQEFARTNNYQLGAAQGVPNLSDEATEITILLQELILLLTSRSGEKEVLVALKTKIDAIRANSFIYEQYFKRSLPGKPEITKLIDGIYTDSGRRVIELNALINNDDLSVNGTSSGAARTTP